MAEPSKDPLADHMDWPVTGHELAQVLARFALENRQYDLANDANEIVEAELRRQRRDRKQ